MNTLLQILKKHIYKILGTIFLLVLENILFLIHPLLIGYAIDGVFNNNYKPLYILIGIYIFSITIASARRMIDTRTYSQIHLNLAESIVHDDEYEDYEEHKRLARVEMTEDIVETLNDDIPMFIESIIQIVGTLFILSQFNISYFGIAFLICILIIIVYGYYTKHIYALNRKLNNHYEGYIDSITRRRHFQFTKYFTFMNQRKIHLSDMEAKIYFFLYLGILGLLVFVLVTEANKPSVTPGNIFAVIAYVINFETGMSLIPYLYQKIIGTKEIINRIDE